MISLDSQFGDFDPNLMGKIQSYSDEIELWNEKTTKFEDSQSEFETYIDGLLQSFDIELIVYDEVENFKSYDDPEFNYPFERRKNLLSRYTFATSIDQETSDYEYPTEEVRL